MRKYKNLKSVKLADIKPGMVMPDSLGDYSPDAIEGLLIAISNTKYILVVKEFSCIVIEEFYYPEYKVFKKVNPLVYRRFCPMIHTRFD